MIDEFDRRHPLVTLIFYGTIVGMTITSRHMGMAVISLICAIVYLMVLGKVTLKKILVLIPVFIISAIINPLFSHKGMTVLFFNPWGNAITLEAVVYGILSALLVCAMIVWFMSFNLLMREDKILSLIGNIAPNVATLISMTIRMFDRLKRKYLEIKSVNARLTKKSIVKNVKYMSIAITWLLENSIDTADSMESRGYGLKKRTSFSNYQLVLRDILVIVYLVGLTLAEIYIIWAMNVRAYYYPLIKIDNNILLYAVFTLHCLSAVLIDLWEEIRWLRLRSKI